MSSVVLAIIMAILAYSTLNIGLALEKKGASSLPNIEEVSFWRNLKNFFTNKIWISGFLLTVISFIFLIIAMNQGSLSIVAPLQAVGLVTLVVFSNLYLKERINSWEIIGIILIIAGVVILGVTSSNENPTYTLSQVNESFLQAKSILFVVMISGLVILGIIASVVKKFLFGSIVFGLAGGIFSGFGDVFTKAFMSGIDFGNLGPTLLFVLSKWYWWLYVLLMAFYNICAGVFPQIAFQKGKAVIVAPIFSVMTLITPVFSGIVIFSEWNDLQPWVLGLKIFSICVIIIGVVFLSYSSAKSVKQLPEEEQNAEIVASEIT